MMKFKLYFDFYFLRINKEKNTIFEFKIIKLQFKLNK